MNVPTANEFLLRNSAIDNEKMLIKFAKLHVEAALEEAYKVSKLESWESDMIKNSYPLEKIK
jgi:hypothetical protein